MGKNVAPREAMEDAAQLREERELWRKTEKAWYTEKRRLVRIEAACVGLLQSADAAWERDNGGHDWPVACAEARNALEVKP